MTEPDPRLPPFTPAEIQNGALQIGATKLIEHMPSQWEVSQYTASSGVFLDLDTHEAGCYLQCPLGKIAELERFTSAYRSAPFWLKPNCGSSEGQLKPETLWILARRAHKGFTLVVPLLNATTRFSLRHHEGCVAVVGETGDPAVGCHGNHAVYIGYGDDPYQLIVTSARDVQRCLGQGRLRVDKPVPDFVESFGWCTWDAFYKEVSERKVLDGLEAFARGGIIPRVLILDDGWQSWQRFSSGEDRLVSLAPNERFGGTLANLISASKQTYGVQRFLVWHALTGYWGGVDSTALPDYAAEPIARWFGPGILEQDPHWNVGPWGGQVCVPPPLKIGNFYRDYHRLLAEQGVDGIKVDNQAMLEAVSHGNGGRVVMASRYRRELEDSADRHFEGRLINCMSSTSECAYLAASSTVMRSSDDFFPNRPESHGHHVFTNAQVSLWFGEFMLGDWDMFQSAHPMGSFHAAARAISGGPVYVSDKPGVHDFALLGKLVLSDGTVLRADSVGKPSPECLFRDPTVEPVLLKVFNTNADCGVLGLFNLCQGRPAGETTGARVGPRDVPSLCTGEYIAYAHRAKSVWRTSRESPSFELAEGEWEIVSFAPIERNFAAIGLTDKLNSTRALIHRRWAENACYLMLRDGGSFLAWAASRPARVLTAGTEVDFSYDKLSGQLAFTIAIKGECEITIEWGS